MLRFETEREVIRLLGADCTVPVGAYSEINGERYLSLFQTARGILLRAKKR